MNNRTHFLIDANTFIVNNDVLFTFESFDILTHEQDSGFLEESPIVQWNEDGVLADFTFSVDNTKNVIINSFNLSLVASDGTNEFNLDTLNVPLSPNTGAPPVLDVDSERGYVLPINSEFNLIEIKDGGTVGTKTFYDGVIGQKITWQDWISNANAPAVFTNPTQKADTYSGENGYNIYIKLTANVTGDDATQGAVTQDYSILSSIINVYDYFESDDGGIVSGTIETFDSTDTYNLNGGYFTNQDTLFKCTWVGSTGLNVSDVAYIIHRIERELAPGNYEIEEISTLRGEVTGGKLENISFVQSGSDIVSTCTIKAGALSGGDWKLSARYKSPPAPGMQIKYCSGSVEDTNITFTLDNTTTGVSQSENAPFAIAADVGDSVDVTVDLTGTKFLRVDEIKVNGVVQAPTITLVDGVNMIFDFTVVVAENTNIEVCTRYSHHTVWDQEHVNEASGKVVQFKDMLFDLSDENPYDNKISQADTTKRATRVTGAENYIDFTGTEHYFSSGYNWTIDALAIFCIKPFQIGDTAILYNEWDASTTYAAGNRVYYFTSKLGCQARVYQSITSSNTGNNPETSGANWSLVTQSKGGTFLSFGGTNGYSIFDFGTLAQHTICVWSTIFRKYSAVNAPASRAVNASQGGLTNYGGDPATTNVKAVFSRGLIHAGAGGGGNTVSNGGGNGKATYDKNGISVWDASFKYDFWDLAIYNGVLYKSISFSTGLQPDTNPLYWAVQLDEDDDWNNSNGGVATSNEVYLGKIAPSTTDSGGHVTNTFKGRFYNLTLLAERHREDEVQYIKDFLISRYNILT